MIKARAYKLAAVEMPDGTFEYMYLGGGGGVYKYSSEDEQNTDTGLTKSIYPSRYKVRNWWDKYITEQVDKFPFYAFLLARDVDKEVHKCIKKYSETLDRETGDKCLLMIAMLKDQNIRDVSEKFTVKENDVAKWQETFESYAKGDIPAKLGWLFGVDTKDFPCLLVFRDLRQWQSIKISLGDMDAKEIIKRITDIMSAARGNFKDPYQGIVNLVEDENTDKKSGRGHSSVHKQKALLAYTHSLIPTESKVLLVGDAEFGEVEVQKLLQKWHWKYVLRQKGRYLVRKNAQADFQRLDCLVSQPGHSQWLEACLLTAKYAYPVNFLAYWKPCEKEPWLLATNLTSPQATRRAYFRRMWIEETFGDLKKNGFDLESTHLHHFLRLSRLTLAVVLLYVWLVACGSQVIKSGQRSLVDRSDRRDFSIFRIGRNMVERLLTNGSKLRFSLVLYP